MKQFNLKTWKQVPPTKNYLSKTSNADPGFPCNAAILTLQINKPPNTFSLKKISNTPHAYVEIEKYGSFNFSIISV